MNMEVIVFIMMRCWFGFGFVPVNLLFNRESKSNLKSMKLKFIVFNHKKRIGSLVPLNVLFIDHISYLEWNLKITERNLFFSL